MDVRIWRAACDHFKQAVELSPEERAALLRDLEPAVRRGVESLLAAEEEAGDFLERPALSPEMRVDLKKAASQARCMRLGPYLLERELSSSGMSRVLLARRDDGEFEKQVAVKVMAHEAVSDELLGRFRRERQILASLDHPNIARLLDGGSTEEGLPYLVMEFVEGTPIDEYCDGSRLSIPERLELFLQVCSAVHYAHERGVVHRDLKASNILVTGDGVPKLIDFGIAKLMQAEVLRASTEETSPGVRPMTPYYASPEQVVGGAITRATDVYSLGVLLFKLLSGRFPYRLSERTAEAVRAAVVAQDAESLVGAVFDADRRSGVDDPDTCDQETPQSVSSARRATPASLRRKLAGDLNSIVGMALRKKPEQRYPTARDLGEDLRRYLEGLPVVAAGSDLGYRTGKFLVRHRARVGAAVVVAWALVALGMVTARSGRLAQEHERLARQNAESQELLALPGGTAREPEPMGRRGQGPRPGQILETEARRAVHVPNQKLELGDWIMESLADEYDLFGSLGISVRQVEFAVSGSCPEEFLVRVTGAAPGGSVTICARP